MILWSRLIAWMDADFGDGWPPDMSGWSGLLWLGPLMIILPPLAYFDPPAQTRYWVVGAAAVPSVLLLAIWGWRLLLALRRGARRMRDTH
jgi:hypothetical protein